MVLEERIALMCQLGAYLEKMDNDLKEILFQAERQNPWFTQQNLSLAITNIQQYFLKEEYLINWTKEYPIFATSLLSSAPTVGIVMAGNIPLVGFHDFLAVFISGCKQKIKLSSKDTVIWNHLFSKLNQWSEEFKEWAQIEERLNNCDAYIATGSNNTAKHFEYYFKNYPHIIRSNKTSVAILNGKESEVELDALSDDVFTYYGLGCRNVTKIFVPKDYNFIPLLQAFNKYGYFLDDNKYKNNYDYQLALLLLNKIEYMSSDSLLLVASDSLYSPISVLHYEYYDSITDVEKKLENSDELQCIVSQSPLTSNIQNQFSLGQAQSPRLTDYADGVNTLDFLASLRKEINK